MSVVYYLRRDDNRTLFELGKRVPEDLEILMCSGAEVVLTGYGIEHRMAKILARDMASDGWSDAVRSRSVAYGRHVARAIARWCDGHPCRFVSEHGFEQWEADPTWDYDEALTGHRYLSDGELLAMSEDSPEVARSTRSTHTRES